ncbi:hypothetical protein DOT_4513 [Desulfosporosinus sp. OT]|nr:hypothetical protein DOT_4513 [Desulfosporosinus sp. OT]
MGLCRGKRGCGFLGALTISRVEVFISKISFEMMKIEISI